MFRSGGPCAERGVKRRTGRIEKAAGAKLEG